MFIRCIEDSACDNNDFLPPSQHTSHNVRVFFVFVFTFETEQCNSGKKCDSFDTHEIGFVCPDLLVVFFFFFGFVIKYLLRSGTRLEFD